MWINLIMECVQTVSYFILVNGEPEGLIQPSRGIKQVDPLTPFLLLLCTKGLHGLIKQAARDGDIKGFYLCKKGPKLSHLFFFSILFCRANSVECGNVLKLLSEYEAFSIKKIVKEKTSIFFSKSTYETPKTQLNVC